ncbi:hypothetical protein BH09BAC3_BH09BAC3_33910 [soil metagenome]
MKKPLTLFLYLPLLVIVLCSGKAQADLLRDDSPITITGRVTEKGSGNPLAYATVTIKGQPIGVVSNLLGEFKFTFSDQFASDTLAISMMGFETYYIIVKAIENRDKLVVVLLEKAVTLDPVLITDKVLTPQQIVEKAVQNIPLNYPQEPYLLNGFYRDFKKENSTYLALLEAAVTIYDKGYTKPSPSQKRRLQENIYINEIRKSKKVAYQAKVYTALNLLDGMMLSNDVRYQQFGLDVTSTTYELERFSIIDDRVVYVIKSAYPWSSRIFIDVENFAVMQIEMDAKWEGIHKNEWVMRDTIMNKTPFIRKNIKFKRYDDKYYLAYMNYSWQIIGFGKKSGKELFVSDFYQELLVNGIVTRSVVKPSKDALMSADKILELQTKPYNTEFWKSYNIIQEAPLNKKIVQDLEAKGSLDDQFKSSGTEDTSAVEDKENKSKSIKKKKRKNL